ncbi:MAG: hypothetical protein HZA15_16755 [Nitrospirae bacterium]|nr:hypothetical protein [Nitrospirota bacterium]
MTLDIRVALRLAIVASMSVIIFLSPIGSYAASYTQQASVVSSGGGSENSAGYVQNSTLGQSSATGLSSGSSYLNYAGFWHIQNSMSDNESPADGSLTATSGNGQVILNWTSATDSGSGLFSTPYKLVRASGATPPADCNSNAIYQGTGLAYTDTGLTNGQTYSYRLCATDGAGNVSIGATATAIPTAPYTKVIVLTPNGGEKIMTGTTYQVTWGAPATAVKFTLQYSINNGTVWKTIATNVTGTSYNWTVPAQTANKPNSLIKVIGFNSVGGQVGFDQSNVKFLMYVVRVTSPNGGESWNSGTVHPITWTTGASIKPISKVNLYYKIDATGYKLITSFTGTNPGTYNWTVPTVTANKLASKVKVELQYTGITAKGNDLNDANFTIKPAGAPSQNSVAGESSEYLIQRVGATDTGIAVTEDAMSVADESLTTDNQTADGQMIVWAEPDYNAVGIGMKSGNAAEALTGEYLTALYGEDLITLNLDRILHTIVDGHLTMTTDKGSYKGLVREDGSIFTITGAEDTGIFGIGMKKTEASLINGTYRISEMLKDGESSSVKATEISFNGGGGYTITDGTDTVAGTYSLTPEGTFETSEGDTIIVSPDGEVITISGQSGSESRLAIGIKKK